MKQSTSVTWRPCRPSTTSPRSSHPRREVLLSRLDAYTLFAWSRFDLDKDGNLNAVEFEAFLRHIAQRDDVTTEDCQRFLRQMDQSGDGLIQRDELVQFAGAWFSGGYPFVVGSIYSTVS